MNGAALWLLSPEISLAFVAMLAFLVDLVTRRKGYVAAVSLVGLVLPLLFTTLLWGELSGWVNVIGPQPGEVAGASIPGIFGTLVIDRYALFFKYLVFGALGLVVLASLDYRSRLGRLEGEYYGLILLSAGGMTLLAATVELLSLYIALELATLPLVALAAFLRDGRSTEAGIKFLLLGAISSAVLLFGMALVFGVTGSTYLSDVAGAVAKAAGGDLPFGSYAMLAGAVMMAAGFGFKIASVPFQMWVPDVYEGSPTPITAYLSVASKAAGFAALLRVFTTAFGPAELHWSVLFAALAVASMTVGNLVAVAQSNIKRMLGYSTIAHAGYMLIGVAAVAGRTGDGSLQGPQGLLFYLGGYAVTNLAAFFAIIAIANRTGSDQINDFAGMGRRAPWLAFLLTVSLLSLIGIPPTAGFMGKLFLFGAAVNADLAWLALVGVINSVLSAYYYLRVVKVMYFQEPASQERVTASPALWAALGSSSLGVVFVGMAPWPLFAFAAQALLGFAGR